MAFDENLAARIRAVLRRKKGIQEKKLFGCHCFLLRGNVLVGVWKNSLIVRLGSDAYDDARMEPHVREFDITGKSMKGWIAVSAEGLTGEDAVLSWVERAAKFVSTLPEK